MIRHEVNKGVEEVCMSLEEYNQLLKCEEMLWAFQEAGVDNWEGYDYAVELLNAE